MFDLREIYDLRKFLLFTKTSLNWKFTVLTKGRIEYIWNKFTGLCTLHIICADDAQEILHRSFEISNPNLNEDISNLLKKDNKWITWTDFHYKVILTLNKRSEQKDSEQKQRPISMASFTGHLESEQCNISSKKPNLSWWISLIYMF